MAVEPGSRMVKYFVDFTGTRRARGCCARGPWPALQPAAAGRPVARAGDLRRAAAGRHAPDAARRAHLRRCCSQQLVLSAADEARARGRARLAAWAAYRRCREHMEAHYASSCASLADAGGRLRHERGARVPPLPPLRRPLAAPGAPPPQDGARRLAAPRRRAARCGRWPRRSASRTRTTSRRPSSASTGCRRRPSARAAAGRGRGKRSP